MIAIVLPTLKAGGAEKQACLLAACLVQRFPVTMVLLSADKISDSEQNISILKEGGVEIFRVGGNIVQCVLRLRRFFLDNKVEVVFNYLTRPNLIGALAGRWANVKAIFGGIRNSHLERWKMLIERFVHNNLSTATICNCFSGAEEIVRKGLRKDTVFTIPNCFVNIADPIIREDKHIKHVVTVGRFVEQKDYYTILRSISILGQRRQDFVLDIVGYGQEEQNIRRWISELLLEKCVNIYIQPSNVQDIIKSADIYLSTSLFEGTSNSIMEALNWSLPVVATAVGDNNKLVLEGKTGYLHAVRDYMSISESLGRLLDNATLRQSMGILGNQHLRENYSLHSFAQRYIRLIESL